jgi:hypothetical protein
VTDGDELSGTENPVVEGKLSCCGEVGGMAAVKLDGGLGNWVING